MSSWLTRNIDRGSYEDPALNKKNDSKLGRFSWSLPRLQRKHMSSCVIFKLLSLLRSTLGGLTPETNGVPRKRTDNIRIAQSRTE